MEFFSLWWFRDIGENNIFMVMVKNFSREKRLLMAVTKLNDLESNVDKDWFSIRKIVNTTLCYITNCIWIRQLKNWTFARKKAGLNLKIRKKYRQCGSRLSIMSVSFSHFLVVVSNNGLSNIDTYWGKKT